MNLAAQLNEMDVTTLDEPSLHSERHPANIIHLAEQGLLSTPEEKPSTYAPFLDHDFSPLNEW